MTKPSTTLPDERSAGPGPEGAAATLPEAGKQNWGPERTKKLRVLVACEFSGIVRNAFLAHGHDERARGPGRRGGSAR